MEHEFRMANIMGLFKQEDILSNIQDFRKARIFDQDSAVCDRFNRKNCYDPDSVKKAFHPLGIFSKIFGLFPCYDFSFVEKKLDSEKLSLIHILDYCYSILIFSLLTGGAIMCLIFQPTLLEKANSGNFDYYLKLALIYATIFAGVQSLFIFPMKWSGVLNFVKLISNIDKILLFDGRKEERGFAWKDLLYMLGCLTFTLVSFFILFVYDEYNENPCLMDYFLAPIMTLALMALVIPTGLAIFFLNAIRLRMQHFNQKLGNMLKPFIPSCVNCVSFYDYGNELDSSQLDKQKLHDLPEDLERMRILYCEIRTMGNCMSCIFGMHLVRDFLYSMVALTLYTYYLISFNEDGVMIMLIYAGQGIFLILKIFTLVCYTQLICYQGIVLEGILQRVSLRRLNDSCCTQIQAFTAVTTKPPIISAAGFFNINKALMTSIVASITTYFIILLQFKFNGTNQETQTSKHF